MLLVISIIPLRILIELVLMRINWIGYLILLFVLLLFLYLISLTFSKKGLIVKDEKLYTAKIFNDFILFKKKVDLEDRPVVSILKFKKRQKLPFFSVAKPDLDNAFNSFEVFVLNERHIKRDSVIYFKNEENAQMALQFITGNFPLRHETFSPDFA